MNVYVKYNERKRLQCVFNTLVIKNEAMERLYEGGLIGFLDKHGGEYNEKITVVCYMGADIDETIDDLVENGLKFLKDFEFIDAGAYMIIGSEKQACPFIVKQKVGWLKGCYVKGYIYVLYNDNYKDVS